MPVVCDFCTPPREIAQEESWVYACRDFKEVVVASDNEYLHTWSRGNWLACEHHSNIIESSPRKQTVLRALLDDIRPQLAERYSNLRLRHAVILSLGASWGQFLEGRRGPRHRPSDQEWAECVQNYTDGAEEMARTRQWFQRQS